MKGSLGLAALAMFLGCAHAKTTDAERRRTKEDPKENAEGAAKDRAPRGGGEEEASRGEKGEPAPRAGQARPEGEPRRAAEPERREGKRSGIPVAAGASGLLEEGADEKIRAKLSEGGYTAGGGGDKVSTEEALRRFQEKNDLPATGMPDHATVRALGLDPDEVFRARSP